MAVGARERSVSGERADRRTEFWFRILIAGCVLLGFTARVWNLDFDQRQHQHPDERFWSMTSAALADEPPRPEHPTLLGPVLDWLDADRSRANPYRVTETFLYGPISLALTRSVAGWLHDGAVDGTQPAGLIVDGLDLVGVPLLDASGGPRFDARYEVDLIGRLLGAITDSITIVLVGCIARRLGGRTAAVAASFLYASCVLAIQSSHFLGSEPLLGLGCSATVLAALRFDRSADRRAAARTGAWAGGAAGFAVAVKLSALGLVAVPGLGLLGLAVRHRRAADAIRLVTMGLVAAVTFRVLQPSAFDGLGLRLSRDFLDDARRSAQLQTDTWPPSFQWVGRAPFVQPFVWLATTTVGPGVFVAAAVAVLILAVRRWGGRVADRVASRWPGTADRLRRAPNSVGDSVDTWSTVVVTGAAAVPFVFVELTAWPTGRYFYPMLPALVVLAGTGVAWALALARHHRGALRSGALVLVIGSVGAAALWAVGFVHGVYGHPHTRIEASRWIADNVPPGSVLSVQAWDDQLPLRLPGIDAAAYPSELLDLVSPDSVEKVAVVAGQLGRIDYVVESSPRIWATVVRLPARFPSTIAFFDALDSGALGFERVATFTSPPRLGPWTLDESGAEEAFSVYDHPEVRIWAKVRSLDRDELVAALDPDAAATAVAVDPNAGTANGLRLRPDEVAENRAGPTFDDAFDRGTGLGTVLAWVVVLELIGLATFVLFLPLLRRLPDAGLGVSKILGLVLLAGAVFACVTWLGRTLDRWLVGVVVATLVGVAARRAWSTRAELAQLWRERSRLLVTVELIGWTCFGLFVVMRGMNPDLWHPNRGGEKPFEQALLTAVLRTRTLPVYDPWFSGGTLNYYYGGWFLLSIPGRLLRTSPMMVMNIGVGVYAGAAAGAASTIGAALAGGRRARWWRRSRSTRRALAGAVVAAGLVLLASSPAVLRPMGDLVRGRIDRRGVDWWALSRVIPDSVAVTEFPAWSLLFADLHPHLMGMAVLLALGVVVLALYDAMRSGPVGHVVLLAAALGLLVGTVRMTNTWDYPLALGLAGILIVWAYRRGVSGGRVIAVASVVAAVVLVFFVPYVERGQVFDGGFERATLRTPLTSWFRQFGFHALIVALVVVSEASRAALRARPRWGRLTSAHLAGGALGIVVVGGPLVLTGRETLLLAVLAMVGCLWLSWWRRDRAGGAGPLPPFVIAVGWAIQVGVETFTVRNDGGRMNTVFKFWYESWIVLSVGVAALVAAELVGRRTLRRTATAWLAAVALASIGFWSLALPVRLDDRIGDEGLTLAGEAYLTAGLVQDTDRGKFVPGDDLPLIDWLRANVAGVRTIAEAPGIDYAWTGRISSSTGLPTPIGWAYHERQQRRIDEGSIDNRLADMTSLYVTTDPVEMARVLARYDIEYVVFGTEEWLLASTRSAAALRSFECLSIRREADRSDAGDGAVLRAYFVGVVDHACVNRLRPLPPPSS